MLTDPKLRSQVDQLWDKLWAGGLSNPLDAIEQLSYLIFLKRLDDAENARERQAQRRGTAYEPRVPADMRWGTWTQFEAAKALEHLRTVIFPWFRNLGQAGSSFERYMQNAECKINKPSLLIEACKTIDGLQISAQNQDVQGDLYEYLLEKLNTAGRNGQFRTPRHVIRMMVEMVDPRPGERIGDLAAGTCGFLVNAYQHILEAHTSTGIIEYDAQGWPHHLAGDLLTDAQRKFLQAEALRGYDNDSGMTMLRIGSMNPPFKGAVDKGDVHPRLPGTTTKTELLFVHLILRALDMGGRCAVIVPDGVLFGSSKAHVELRRKLIEENRLDGVVSMPGGVFKPYAGVSTAVLLFTRGGTTDRIWFYDMEHDGFSLDDKRQPVANNDIPDILECWRNRGDAGFHAGRETRLKALQAQVAPLKAERLKLHAEINRLTFESAIAPPPPPPAPPPHAEEERGDDAHALLDAAKQKLAEIEAQVAPLQAEINQLSRQFWVTTAQVKANKYDLSASRYRHAEQDGAYYEDPRVTLERMLLLDRVIDDGIHELQQMIRAPNAELNVK